MKSEHLYKSSFNPSDVGLSVLEKGKILMAGESPTSMVERVVNDIAGAERLFSVSAEDLNIFADKLGNLIDGQMIVFSTPIMTNAWRTENKPLSACTVPSVDLRGDLKLVKKTVDSYHQEAMGTGF